LNRCPPRAAVESRRPTWTDGDRVHKLITEDIPNRVAADKALARVMTAVLKDDTELFKQFSDNESFRRWLTDTVFSITYSGEVRP
jgi:type I restriction enzyme, R subunit